jgi:tetratricopeptide (TPR) repeat protein
MYAAGPAVGSDWRAEATFVVQETLSGRGGRLKAYTIATVILNRDSDFDPKNSSVVRVQATRLRQLLENYYEKLKTPASLRIVLPKGSYAPEFAHVSVCAGSQHELYIDTVRTRIAKLSHIPHRALVIVVLLLIGLTGAIWSWLFVHQRVHMWPEIVPVVVVLRQAISTVPDRASMHLDSILGRIEDGLAAYDHLRVGQFPEAQGMADYGLRGTIEPAGGAINLRLVAMRSAEVVWSKRLEDGDLTEATRLDLVAREVIEAVGDVFGAVNTDILNHSPIGPAPRGYHCWLAAFQYLKSISDGDLVRAKVCLEAELARDSDNAQALSLLSIVLIRTYIEGSPEAESVAILQRALQLARRAVDREPQRARSQLAMFLARFYDKRFDDAFVAGQQALHLNPYSSLISAAIGSALVSRGRIQDGLKLLAAPDMMVDLAPGRFATYLALAYYAQDQVEPFRRFAVRQSVGTSTLGLSLQAVECLRRGDAVCLETKRGLLRDRVLKAKSSLVELLDRYALAPEISRRLISDLQAAQMLQFE